ncbi:Transmembrane protein 163 [Tupaia chinensis]|uniref:Transmembrane protein 163 n=1 Tax=Tupaia chinensis TaxID=246437 RepID=L8Y578_TUPCH|nr:Transmembrane protein 163 [Tupaia chinensis]
MGTRHSLCGLLESSTRLKPHEAQNYRKKALWVSWFSIIVTLALAVAAFSLSSDNYNSTLVDTMVAFDDVRFCDEFSTQQQNLYSR